ncbi:MAG: MFS transporter [Alphaproteobacteria bacterium]|nr:MFS transporter [Alphaproteobacteria bacterium]
MIEGLSEITRRRIIVAALGMMQILAWGSSFFLMAVLGKPIAADTGWSLTWTVGALSIALLTSGLASPYVGRLIDRRGGRPVLLASTIFFAAGLVLIAMSPHLIVFFAGWILVGLGMSAGLYDASFSTLGRLYGEAARQPITAVTLFGGLASSICWPLTAYLNEALGWRETCLTYAAVHLFVGLPLYFITMPREAERPPHAPTEASTATGNRATFLFLGLAASFSLMTLVASTNAVHMLTFLQSHGLPLATAVTLAAMVGIAQVAARGIEMAIGRFHHPIWTLVASTVLVGAGVALLWWGAEPFLLALVIYGAGAGVNSIARGTVPLALFGPDGYAARMGRLAQPTFIASAVAPTLGAFAIESWGTDATLAGLSILSLVNIAIVASLVVSIRRQA